MSDNERRIHDVDDGGLIDDADPSLAGDYVRWRNGAAYKLERMPNGGLGFRAILQCSKCNGMGHEVFITRGAPGWCYVYSLAGKYEANLRDQNYVCSVCSTPEPRRRAT